MAKNKVSEWSATPADNTDVGGIDINEGCAPSGINNAIRDVMAQIKDMQTGADGDNFAVGGNLSVTGTTTIGNELIANGSAGTSGQVLSSRGAGLSPQYQTLNLSASGISNTPAGNISATNVQGAINELDTEKQAALGFTPVQQGGGSGQGTNKVYVGWGGSGLKAQVDATDLGTLWAGQATASSLSGTGYQRFPSGLIMQWGSGTVNGSAVNFAIAFPNAVFSATVSGTSASSSTDNVHINLLNTSQIRAAQVGGGSYTYYYIAIGY
jgi:hypothetical protein